MSEAGMHFSDLNGGPVEWISKSEAARLLDKSERTILSMASSGKLRSKQERDASKGGQKVTLLHAGDVARWASASAGGLNGGDEFSGGRMPWETGQPVDEISLAPLVRQSLANLSVPEFQLSEIRPTNAGYNDTRVLVPARPWLTLGEAAEYSGLPKSVILTLIEASQLKAIDCGPRPGGRYRVKRSDLDALEGMNL